jgi:hypothetical protein
MSRSPTRDPVVGLFVLAGIGAMAYLSISIGGCQLVSNREAQALGASGDHVAQPIRAALVHQRVAGATGWRPAAPGGGKLLDDDLDETLEVGGLHQLLARSSRSRILARRRM